MKVKNLFVTALIAIVSTVVTLAMYEKFYNGDFGGSNSLDNPFQLTSANFPVAPSGMAPVDFTYAAALTTPSVVHVKTTYKQTGSAGTQDDIFRQFFGDDFNWGEGNQQASGSGVIISDDGYIVTNYHVVKNADKIQVVFFDRHQAIAELVASDPSTDIAVLRVDLKDLPNIKFGDSDSVRVGDWVMAEEIHLT